MTRIEFMNQLRSKLYKRLSEAEISEALAYYEEYFEEAGPAGELQAVQDLGEPSAIAAQVIRERALQAADNQPLSVKKGFSAAWVVVLGLFALPIALPLIAFLAIALLALVGAILAVVVGIFFLMLIAFGIGLFGTVVGLAVMGESLGTGLIYIGGGMALVGLMLLGIPALLGITSATFRAIASMVNGIINWFNKRKNKKNKSEDDHDFGAGEKDFLDSTANKLNELGSEIQTEFEEGAAKLTRAMDSGIDKVSHAFDRTKDQISISVSGPRNPGLGRRSK